MARGDVAVFDGQIIDIAAAPQITEQSDIIVIITVDVHSRDVMVITVNMPDGLFGWGPFLRGGGSA